MTVSEQEIAEIEERWAKASKGPWYWTLDESNKHVTLFNIGSMVVMDFVRWGMNSCVPRFRIKGLMVKASEISQEIPGREHHSNWAKSINHPDAQAIERAPEDVRKLLEYIRELKT